MSRTYADDARNDARARVAGPRGGSWLVAVFLIGLVALSVPSGAFAADGWTPAAPMAVNRTGPTATLLQSGKVLLVGGAQGIAAVAETYDPAKNAWSPAGSLTALPERVGQTATLLADGRVLVAGGSALGTNVVSPSAELYDPATNSWSPAASMTSARTNHSATLLPNGRVLVAGGISSFTPTTSAATAELYDPATNTWSPGPSMASRRSDHTATLLSDGRVLVSGGGDGPVASAELYDAASNIWAPAANMTTARKGQQATLLADGRVLVVGGAVGFNPPIAVTASGEVYDPATDTWSAIPPMSTARDLHTATRLTDGRVLVVGGLTGGFTDPDIVTTELYNPATNSWSPGPNTSGSRVGHTATLLRDGRVLVAGGFGSSPVLRTGAELFGPLGAGTDGFAQADDVGLLPKPRLGSSVNIARVRGVVTVRLPGRTDSISIEKAAHVPLGSIIDTTHGQVRLYSVGEKSGALQNGLFYDGAFKIGQITKGVPLTVLALAAGDASVCKGFRPASSRPAAGVVQIKSSTRRGDPAQNHLWGNGKGHFRTKGKGSYATVRGTIWKVENHCFTTRTTVRRGVVAVFDRGLNRTILVHAGGRYVAKLR